MVCGKLEELATSSRQSFQARRDKSNELACFALFRTALQENFSTSAISFLGGLYSAML